MRKTPLQIFALASVLSFVGAVGAAARKSPDKPTDKKVLEDLAGYKGWTRVTAEPLEVPTNFASGGGWFVAIDTRAVGAPMVVGKNSAGTTTITLEGLGAPRSGGGKKRDNHDSTFGVVYVNDLAREAFESDGRTKFPVGSTIVREKLARADATQPELVAVMIKRAPGFNPKGGDWEFLTADGTLGKVRERQKKGSCLNCHSSKADRDFVFPPPPPGLKVINPPLDFANPPPPKFP